MSRYDFDLFVIGAGSGGVRAARVSARLGARVAIAEMAQPGGTCVNAGCVPKKLLYYGSTFAEAFRDANGYGWDVLPPQFNWNRLIQHKDSEILRLNQIYTKLMVDAGIVILYGKAVLTGPHSVHINGKIYTAEHILIATGATPVLPNIPGANFSITSNEAFHLPQLPEKIIIIGGGYIAVEFAGIFNGLGVQTTLIHRGDLPLRGFDEEAREVLAEEIIKKGVQLLLNTEVTAIESAGGQLNVQLNSGKYESAGLVLCALGRRPNTDSLGLEIAGVLLDKEGAVVVNRAFQTNIPSILALGDVTNRLQLTPVAITEAMALASTLFGSQPTEVDYANVASCVFSQPNLASVGLTEEQAREQYGEINVFRNSFRPMKHTMTGINEKTFMKLIVDQATDRVIGAHMVGAEAGEIIQGIAIAIKAGVTKSGFDSTIGIHPTAAEEFVTMKMVPR